MLAWIHLFLSNAWQRYISSKILPEMAVRYASKHCDECLFALMCSMQRTWGWTLQLGTYDLFEIAGISSVSEWYYLLCTIPNPKPLLVVCM